jgi:hypothetical protein
MLSGWTAVNTATLATAVLALIGSVFSAVYTVRAQKARSNLENSLAAAAEQIAICRQQLSDFYRPLQQHRASSALLRDLLPAHPWRMVQHLPEMRISKEASVVDMILEEGDKIVDIITKNIVHQESGPNQKGVRSCFVMFIKHQVLLREAWSQLTEAYSSGQDLSDVQLTEISDTPFPLDLDNCIRLEVEQIQARIAKFHGVSF